MGLFAKVFGKKKETQPLTETQTLIHALEGLDPNEKPVQREEQAPWVEKALSSFYDIEAPDGLDVILKEYPSDKLGEVVRAIDLKGMATYHNRFKTGSTHRVKVLALSRRLERSNRPQDRDLCYDKLLEMIGWSNSEITPSDFLLLMDLGKDLMSAAHARQSDSGYYKSQIGLALRVFERITTHAGKGSEGYVEAMQWKAACHTNLGDYEKAKEAFEDVLKHDPNNKMANDILPQLKRLGNK